MIFSLLLEGHILNEDADTCVLNMIFLGTEIRAAKFGAIRLVENWSPTFKVRRLDGLHRLPTRATLLCSSLGF